MSAIMGTSGQSWVELGGDRTWGQQRVKGDIVCSFQWLQAGKKEPQACMVLFPATIKLDGGAYAIPQENAYEYVASDGNPTPHLMVAAFNAAQSMGFYADQSTVFRIVDIIADGLPDLIRMPSDQPVSLDIKAPAIGIEATAKVNGITVHQEVI